MAYIRTLSIFWFICVYIRGVYFIFSNCSSTFRTFKMANTWQQKVWQVLRLLILRLFSRIANGWADKSVEHIKCYVIFSYFTFCFRSNSVAVGWVWWICAMFCWLYMFCRVLFPLLSVSLSRFFFFLLLNCMRKKFLMWIFAQSWKLMKRRAKEKEENMKFVGNAPYGKIDKIDGTSKSKRTMNVRCGSMTF